LFHLSSDARFQIFRGESIKRIAGNCVFAESGELVSEGCRTGWAIQDALAFPFVGIEVEHRFVFFKSSTEEENFVKGERFLKLAISAATGCFDDEHFVWLHA